MLVQISLVGYKCWSLIKLISQNVWIPIKLMGGCIICNFWYFLGINFRFQPKVCNGCHNMTQKIYDLQ